MARRRIALIIVWAVSLIIAGAFARAQSHAQRGTAPAPTIISGSDLGFRVARQQGNRVVGTFVVRNRLPPAPYLSPTFQPAIDVLHAEWNLRPILVRHTPSSSIR